MTPGVRPVFTLRSGGSPPCCSSTLNLVKLRQHRVHNSGTPTTIASDHLSLSARSMCSMDAALRFSRSFATLTPYSVAIAAPASAPARAAATL